MNWYPIIQAPRDGSRLLLRDKRGNLFVGFFGKHNHVPLYGWVMSTEFDGEEVEGVDPIFYCPIPPVEEPA